MDGYWGSVKILPDQIQILNSFFILLFLPLFQGVIYPILGKCFRMTHLQKMSAGQVIACLAFVVSGSGKNRKLYNIIYILYRFLTPINLIWILMASRDLFWTFTTSFGLIWSRLTWIIKNRPIKLILYQIDLFRLFSPHLIFLLSKRSCSIWYRGQSNPCSWLWLKNVTFCHKRSTRQKYCRQQLLLDRYRK